MNDGAIHNGVEYVTHGLKLLWRGFVGEIRESWQQAYRDTHDVCTHPEAMRTRDDWNMTVTCGLCGRQAYEEAIACNTEPIWETPEERNKPRIYRYDNITRYRVFVGYEREAVEQ